MVRGAREVRGSIFARSFGRCVRALGESDEVDSFLMM